MFHAELPVADGTTKRYQLALAALAAGGGQSAAELVPRYVRRAEAEVTRTAERFEP